GDGEESLEVELEIAVFVAGPNRPEPRALMVGDQAHRAEALHLVVEVVRVEAGERRFPHETAQLVVLVRRDDALQGELQGPDAVAMLAKLALVLLLLLREVGDGLRRLGLGHAEIADHLSDAVARGTHGRLMVPIGPGPLVRRRGNA